MSAPSPTPRRDAIRGSIDPLARGMARVGLSANRLTVIGFLIAAAGGALAAGGFWLVAGIVATGGAAFDMFDGAVARVTGTSSKLGAFLDSSFDRWGETTVYLGCVIGCTQADVEIGAWLAAAAMGNAFMVSYTRARAESLGYSSGRGMAAVGLAPREVRTAILGVGLVGAGLAGGVSAKPDLSTGALILTAALGLIAVLAAITALQRILFVVRQGPTPR